MGFDLISLQDLCLEASSHYLSHLPPMELYMLNSFHKYLSCASPFIPKIAQMNHYYWFSDQTLLFIPFLLRSGELHVTEQNVKAVLSWLSLRTCEDDVLNIKKLKVFSVNEFFAESNDIHSFLAQFSNIPHLILGLNLTDDMFSLFGLYYNKLEILDAREAEIDITDAGLGFLSHCKALRIIIFSSVTDEYDYEDKLKFTSKGIALLILTLTRLERIECPEYILRDALHYINNMHSKVKSLSIKSLFLAYPEVKIDVSLLPKLCPYITTLSLTIATGYERNVSESLMGLPHLKKLKLQFQSPNNLLAFNMAGSNNQIEFLIIDTLYLSEQEIFHLSSKLKNLNTLILNLHSLTYIPSNFENFEENATEIKNLFPSIHTIQLGQWISTKLFKIIGQNCKNLRKLYCKKAVMNELEDAINNIISKGGWGKLELLVLPQKERNPCKILLEHLPKLKELKYVSVELNDEENKRIKSDYRIKFKLCSEWDVFNPIAEFFEL